MTSITPIPFIGSVEVLKVTSAGSIFTNRAHDISICFPKGAIPDGLCAHIETGVTLSGPFAFEEDRQLISPLLFIFLQENIQLLKPVEIRMPHTITDLLPEEVESFDVRFDKASHNYNDCFISQGRKSFRFKPVSYKSQFVTSKGQGFGVLEAKSLCFYCITRKIKPDADRRDSYRISILTSRAKIQDSDPPRYRDIVDIRVTHALETCRSVSV